MAQTLEEYQLIIASNAQSAVNGLNNMINTLYAFAQNINNVLTPTQRFADQIERISVATRTIDFTRVAREATNFANAMGQIAKKTPTGKGSYPAFPLDATEQFVANASKQDTLEMQREGQIARLSEELGNPNRNSATIANLTNQIQQTDAAIAGATDTAQQFAQAIAEGTGKATNLITKLQGIVEKLSVEFAKSQDQWDLSKIASLTSQYQQLSAQIKGMTDTGTQNARQFAEGLDEASIQGMKLEGVMAKLSAEYAKGPEHWDAGKIANLSAQYQKLSSQIENAGQSTSVYERIMGKVEKSMGRVSKIFSSMLIRQASKAIISAFSEAFKSVYNFSEAVGGEFAQNIDDMKNALGSAAIECVKTFEPAIAALTPVVKVVTSAVKTLCEAIQWLLSLIGYSSGLFGTASEEIAKYGSSSSKTTQNLLASFDELNVISKSSGGSGSGSGWDFSGITDEFEEQLTALKVLVGEAMLAIGLIFAFTGHYSIGIPMALLGAASIVSAVTQDWGMCADEVKDQITAIMTTVGGAMLAVGAIIALSGGNVGLGIALMAVGAANLATAVALNWNGLGENTRQALVTVTAVLSGALLAVGGLIALSGVNTPLGIALMAAGAVSLVTSVALAWTGEKDKIESVLSILGAVIGGATLVVGGILAFSGSNVPLGIALMSVGAVSLASAVALSWDGVSNEVKNVIAVIAAALGGALLAIGAVLAFSGANLPLGIGMMAVGAVSLATSAAINWGDDLEKNIKTVVTTLTTALSGALLVVGAILAFSGANIPLGIGMMAAGGVGLAAAITLNWDTLVDSVTTAFTSVKKTITGCWDAVKKATNNAWTAVSTWWTENISDNISAAWDAISGWFVENVWGEWKSGGGGIAGGAYTAWEKIKTWWGNIKDNFELAWSVISTWFGKNVWGSWKENGGGVLGESYSAWIKIKSWWTGIKTAFSTGWDSMGTWFKENVWGAWKEDGGGVLGAAYSAWIKIKSWWTNIKNMFSTGWDNMGTWFKENVWGAWKEKGGGILGAAYTAWIKIKTWWTGIKTSFNSGWDNMGTWFKDNVWGSWKEKGGGILGAAYSAWIKIKSWWTNIKNMFSTGWNDLGGWFKDNVWGAWSSKGGGILGAAYKAWLKIKTWWGGIQKLFNSAWSGLGKWFTTNVWGNWNNPNGSGVLSVARKAWNAISRWWDTGVNGISKLFSNAWSGITETLTGVFQPVLDFVNDIWDALKAIFGYKDNDANNLSNNLWGSAKAAEAYANGLESYAYWTQRGEGSGGGRRWVEQTNKIQMPAYANGAYGIPSGDVFVANDGGTAEFIGSINGKTTVANNGQIIEGIRQGVHDANSEQNALLRQQNELLRAILAKDSSLSPSAQLGRIVNVSQKMFAQTSGV